MTIGQRPVLAVATCVIATILGWAGALGAQQPLAALEVVVHQCAGDAGRGGDSGNGETGCAVKAQLIHCGVGDAVCCCGGGFHD